VRRKTGPMLPVHATIVGRRGAADVRGTDFRGADLRGAKHLTQDQTNTAIVDASTKLTIPLTTTQSGSHVNK